MRVIKVFTFVIVLFAMTHALRSCTATPPKDKPGTGDAYGFGPGLN